MLINIEISLEHTMNPLEFSKIDKEPNFLPRWGAGTRFMAITLRRVCLTLSNFEQLNNSFTPSQAFRKLPNSTLQVYVEKFLTLFVHL